MANTAGGLFISILLVSALFIGAGNFMVDITDTYGVPVTNKAFNETFNVYNDLFSITEDLSTDEEQPEGYSTEVQSIDVLFWGGINTLARIPNVVLKVVFSGYNMLGDLVGLPYWVRPLLEVGITATFAFMLYSILMKWKVI